MIETNLNDTHKQINDFINPFIHNFEFSSCIYHARHRRVVKVSTLGPEKIRYGSPLQEACESSLECDLLKVMA